MKPHRIKLNDQVIVDPAMIAGWELGEPLTNFPNKRTLTIYFSTGRFECVEIEGSKWKELNRLLLEKRRRNRWSIRSTWQRFTSACGHKPVIIN